MKQSGIRKSFDRIEPRPGAKERMFQKIMEKAGNAEEGDEPEKQVRPMWYAGGALSAAACLCIVYFGVKSVLPPDFGKASTNYNSPIDTVESAEDFRQLGIFLDVPEGAEDVTYVIIDGTIAGIDFFFEGHEYFVRASGQSGDFSGVSGAELMAEQIDSRTNATLYQLDSESELYWKASWEDGETNYYLSNTDGASDDEMMQVVSMFIE